jgi:hypothetical protein
MVYIPFNAVQTYLSIFAYSTVVVGCWYKDGPKRVSLSKVSVAK